MTVFFFLLALSFLDIVASPVSGRLSLILVAIFPSAYLLIRYLGREKPKIPAGAVYFLVFILLSLISLVFSVDKQVSIERMIVYFGGFLTFILAFNEKKKLEAFVSKYSVLTGAFYIGFFVAGRALAPKLFSSPWSLFYYYGHNQLGNLLVLPLFAASGFFPLVIIIFMLISYSRSTYLAVLASVFFSKYRLSNGRTLTVIAVLMLVIGLFLGTGSRSIMKTNTVLGSRELYFGYAVSAIKEKPLWGFGPGNFYYAASSRQNNYYENTSSSHNIILDMLVENGIFSGTLFVIFMGYLLIRGRRSKLFPALFALTIVFMLDFTHIFSYFIVLWFFLAGLAIEDNRTMKFPLRYAVIPPVFCQMIIISQFLYSRGDFKNAVFAYPLSKDAYASAVVRSIDKKDNDNANKLLSIYSSLYDGDFEETYKIARYYEYLGDNEKARAFYRRTLELKPFLIVTDKVSLEKYYSMEAVVNGPWKAGNNVKSLLDGLVDRIPKSIRRDNILTSEINDFCLSKFLTCHGTD